MKKLKYLISLENIVKAIFEKPVKALFYLYILDLLQFKIEC